MRNLHIQIYLQYQLLLHGFQKWERWETHEVRIKGRQRASG